MPRALNTPPFPESPGNWITAYRYRGLRDGTRPSAEQLSRLLGVSGATVRRWESDRLRPTQPDLLRFSEACSLSAIEREFLLHAFGNVNHEIAPSQEGFEMLADQILNSVVPTFVMDSLFYIRLWNSYMPDFAGVSGSGRRPHAIVSLFDHNRYARRPANEADPVGRWVRNFWYSSAGLTSTSAFRDILGELRQYEDFTERWWQLALTRQMGPNPINLPIIYDDFENGSYYVLTSTIIVPPVYLLRHYLPVDDKARAFLTRLRETSPRELRRSVHRHWSEEPATSRA